MPTTHIALLRGINVGGKNKLPMEALKEIFADAGCEDVRTYIQSGNIIFNADAKLTQQLPTIIAAKIKTQFNYEVPVILRTARALEAIIENNPFNNPNANPKHLSVAFLSKKPSKPNVQALDPNRSPGDQWVLANNEIYLNFPNGIAKTKLTNAYFDRTLQCITTVRNWNTTTRLLALANE